MTTKHETERRNPDHDRQAAGIYRAIALRSYCRYVAARHNAADYCGDDLAAPAHDPLPTERQAADEYRQAVDEWLTEPPASAAAVLALIEFAAAIAADRIVSTALRDAFPISDEVDALHQALALGSAGGWIYENVALEEWLKRRPTPTPAGGRAAHGVPANQS